MSRHYLTKCGECNKKFISRIGGWLERLLHRDNKKEVVQVPWYGRSGAECPRCGSKYTKTVARLNIPGGDI